MSAGRPAGMAGRGVGEPPLHDLTTDRRTKNQIVRTSSGCSLAIQMGATSNLVRRVC